jgi:hypothetical protein
MVRYASRSAISTEWLGVGFLQVHQWHSHGQRSTKTYTCACPSTILLYLTYSYSDVTIKSPAPRPYKPPACTRKACSVSTSRAAAKMRTGTSQSSAHTKPSNPRLAQRLPISKVNGGIGTRPGRAHSLEGTRARGSHSDMVRCGDAAFGTPRHQLAPERWHPSICARARRGRPLACASPLATMPQQHKHSHSKPGRRASRARCKKHTGRARAGQQQQEHHSHAAVTRCSDTLSGPPRRAPGNLARSATRCAS